MTAAFAANAGAHLAERLLAALEAGLAAGGEAGPVHSAALLVVHEQPFPLVDLRCDWDDENPVAVLRRLSVKIPNVRVPIASLSGGQRQSVAVARSVMGASRVVFLDEPTGAVGVAHTREVLALVKRLRDEGQGVVIISHNLADVFEVADRICLLRLGRRVGTYDAREVSREQLVGLMTGALSGLGDGEDRTAANGACGRERDTTARRRSSRPASDQRYGGLGLGNCCKECSGTRVT